MPGLRRLAGVVVVANLGEVVSLRDVTTAVLDDGRTDGWMESLFSTWRHICSPGKAIFAGGALNKWIIKAPLAVVIGRLRL